MKSHEVLFMFFTTIIAGDFKKAHGLTSKTWAENNGPDVLKKQFKDLPENVSFLIEQVIKELPTEQVHVVTFNAEGKTGNAKAGMICESWPGKKSAQGDWGVDPDNIEAIKMVGVERVSGEKKPQPVAPAKKEPAKEPDSGPLPDHSEILAKAEDMGIDVPEGVTADQIQALIQKEMDAQVAKPAPEENKPAVKKPAAKKGGR